MTGREIVNLINSLQKEGISTSKIVDIIKYIDLTESETTDKDNTKDNLNEK